MTQSIVFIQPILVPVGGNVSNQFIEIYGCLGQSALGRARRRTEAESEEEDLTRIMLYAIISCNKRL
jgi:hypothetical protein